MGINGEYDALIALLHQSHKELRLYMPKNEYIPWDWVDAQVTQLAEKSYQQAPHWHHWSGRCMGIVPFELRIAAMGIFGVSWFYDIMLRKSRDRRGAVENPEESPSWQATEKWRKDLEAVLDLIRAEVLATRDEEAERRHEDSFRLPGKLRHWWNSLQWGH